MSSELFVTLIALIIIMITFGVIIFKRIPKRLKPEYFGQKWRDLQQFCAKRETWPEAISAADRLLDEALKRRRFSGKTMGERLVSAQRSFTNNDRVWFAHNIFKKVQSEPSIKLKESDVKQALLAFGQALRDLGAL